MWNKFVRMVLYYTGAETEIVGEVKREIGSKMVFASQDFEGDLKTFLLEGGSYLQKHNYIPYKVISAKLNKERVNFLKQINL